MHTKVLYFLKKKIFIAVLHEFYKNCLKKNRVKKTRFINIYSETVYFFTTAISFIFALISIEIDERSIFNFPDMVSITIVFSANSEIFP